MNNLIIFGSGGHSRSVLSIAKLTCKWKNITIVDLNSRTKEEFINSTPVITFQNMLKNIASQKSDAFIAIGNNLERSKLFKKLIDYKFSFPNLIHPNAYIDSSATIGCGNYIGQFSNIGASAKVGDFNIINSYANLEHEVNIGNFNQLAPSATICGRTVLKNMIFCGANSVIIEKLKINENTIIGAGAVVINDILNSSEIYIGVPAIKK